MMISSSDPRLGAFIDTSGDVIGPYYGSIPSPVPMMTYAEQKFIEAECNLGTDDAAAADASNAGAIASVELVTGSSPDATWTTAYASETNTSITLEKIIIQKYLANFTNPQAYSDWRRTNFPTLLPNAGAAIPRRLIYPQTEIERNSNTPSGINLTTKVWWDN
jgi:hypothetical protein